MAVKNHALDQKIVEAARAEFLEKGFRGASLQQIAARAMLKDEATSALDAENERAFFDAVDTLTREKTVVMIAHRLSTVERVDRILALRDGRIVQNSPPPSWRGSRACTPIFWPPAAAPPRGSCKTRPFVDRVCQTRYNECLPETLLRQAFCLKREGTAMANIIELHSFDQPELDVFTRLTEAQLRNKLEPEKGVFIAESPKVIDRALKAGYEPVSLLMERKHLEGDAADLIARCGDLPVYTADRAVLEDLTGYQLTRGVLCAMRRRPLPTVEEICRSARRIAILESIVDPTNVGAIFRSAAALNMDAVLVTPTCCDPLYRRAVRVSMGTVFQIPWTKIGATPADWPEQGMDQLHVLGFKTAAMALRDNSVSIDDPGLLAEDKLAIILGTEGDGLASKTIADCDYTVRIPMSHEVDSLNVAAASAVAFWQLRTR